jgi:hypothetical protein
MINPAENFAAAYGRRGALFPAAGGDAWSR